MRKVEFANGEYYHVYNRGVDKREVFLSEKDYLRFIIGMNEFNSNLNREQRLRVAEKSELNSGAPELSSDFSLLVEIVAYCLNSNHYHLILKQIGERGVERFMHKLSTGYTNYFNKRAKRSGTLFQGRYKSVFIDSNEYLLYLSVYVNCNNFIHGYSQNSSDWPYGSYLDYTGKRNGRMCVKETILGQFNGNFGEYEKFCLINVKHLKEKKKMQKYLLEE